MSTLKKLIFCALFALVFVLCVGFGVSAEHYSIDGFEIPIDVIKVDQSFVKDLAGDAYSQSFIKMVAELAQTIGVSVCVEGIETPEQFKVLQGMKVKYIQGYYFDRPMERHAFEAKYEK